MTKLVIFCSLKHILLSTNSLIFAFLMKIRELAKSDYNQVIELWTKSLSNKFDNEINTEPSF